MGKSEITKEIEGVLRTYDPANLGGIAINKFRGRHIAFEVPVECGTTTAGIVDAVEISEYFGGNEHRHVCYWHDIGRYIAGTFKSQCNRSMDTPPQYCDVSCPWRRSVEIGTPKILVTCFEIKVTVSDFKSKNGHNFVGNLNYYVVPIELYPQIKELTPEDIGILVYYDGKGEVKKNAAGYSVYPYFGIRKKKDAAFKSMSDEDQKWMILSVLKRIRRSA